jgi:DNA (cytosine-5)-methyltransferase 1
MENVLGIRSAAGGDFFTRVQAEARALGYRVHGEAIRAWQYGVPQKRARQLIIGTRRELPVFAGAIYMPSTHGDGNLHTPVTLWEAIGDLPPLQAGQGVNEAVYDIGRRKSHVARYGGRYLKKVLGIHCVANLSGHVARPHNDRDLRDFHRLKEGEHSAGAIARGERMEFPYDRESFKDRYTRQHRNELCSTIVAHLSKDGLMFIHPTQARSLTPREAARLQSFPDWFQFPEARTHAFRLIGNAVPPLVGKVVGQAIQRLFADTRRPRQGELLAHMPTNFEQALDWMRPLVFAADRNALSKVSNIEFLRGWFSLAFVHWHLHPDSATQNGTETSRSSFVRPLKVKADSRLFTPTYRLSGWPVKLVPLALEAQRRLQAKTLASDDYYCSYAHKAGAERIHKDEELRVRH